MKLIIDAQLPRKLCDLLHTLGISTLHVEELPHGDETSDYEVAKYADANHLTVAAKDLNFYYSHTTVKRPAKLLLITTGNISNRKLFKLFVDNYSLIKKALDRSDFVELDNEGIIEFN